MTETSEQRAENDLEFQLRLVREIEKDAFRESRAAAMVARNVLREELGYFGEYQGAGYKLSEAEKNRLLAHGRQDAAHAALAASKALDMVQDQAKRITGLRRLLWTLVAMVAGLIVLTVRYSS